MSGCRHGRAGSHQNATLGLRELGLATLAEFAGKREQW
jgi:hypothetical protein